MTKQATATATAVDTAVDTKLADQAAPLVKELSLAVKQADKASRRIVAAVLAFRDLETDEKHVKAFLTDAYVAAGFDEKSKTLASRRSEALVLFRAPTIPAVLPASLQAAAKMVRGLEDYQALSQSAGRQGAKAGKAPSQRAPRQTTGPAKADDAPSKAVAPMDVDAIRAELLEHVNALKGRASDEAAASLLAELVDVLS